jgi:hypothetical protein
VIILFRVLQKDRNSEWMDEGDLLGELFHAVMEAEKSYDRLQAGELGTLVGGMAQSTTGRPQSREANGVILSVKLKT